MVMMQTPPWLHPAWRLRSLKLTWSKKFQVWDFQVRDFQVRE